MIPVSSFNYSLINLDQKITEVSEIKYLTLLKNQLNYLNANYFEIISKSNKLYNLYINNRLPQSIKDRCCNFPLLEEKCNEYNSSKVLQGV